MGLELLGNQFNWTIDNKSIIKSYYKEDFGGSYCRSHTVFTSEIKSFTCTFAYVSLISHTTSNHQEENEFLDLIKAS